jgi:hypothetical protein
MYDAGGMIGVQHVAQSAHADIVIEIQKADMAFMHEADADFAVAELRLAQLHR